MNRLIRLNKPIIVEGKYDKITLENVVDGLIIPTDGFGIFKNKEGRLPDAPGRIWYEADLNYYSGKRNNHRLLWSNDGLFFVTYDHYESFMEVVGG